jgi:DNA-binding PadR family transcriptional regulator
MPSTTAPSKTLTTTAYAILGVLAIKPRTAYELALEMRHCFEYFWARDDARVYKDAKTLAAADLVTAQTQLIGKRPRTTFTLTQAGRAALDRWLERPSQPASLEFESLIKVFLARFGTLEQLRSTVQQVQADAEYRLQVATNVRQLYLEGCAPFQDEYVHVWAFVYDFQVSNFQMLHAWATRTLNEIKSWTDLAPEAKRERGLQIMDTVKPARWLKADLGKPAAAVPALPGMYHRRRQRPLD